MRPRRATLGARHLAALLGLLLAAVTCSRSNKVGPDATCAELDCGRLNACEHGIIAACPDGETMQYHVCKSSSCEESWQVHGQYRCDEFDLDCDGCQPSIAGCGSDAGSDAGP